MESQGNFALMLDIETLSLSPRSHVTQVGFCAADLDTGKYIVAPGAWLISPEQQRERDKDFDTICWWMQQDRAVADGIFNPAAQRVSPQYVFDELCRFTAQFKWTVWGSPAMFDLPILTDLWRGQKPWKYNVERDLYTLSKAIDPEGNLKPAPNEKQHDAAADAHWQMEYLLRVWAKLNKLRIGTPIVALAAAEVAQDQEGGWQ